jgi:hypothetical protein
MNSQPASTAADIALGLRDQALAALDAARPSQALVLSAQALSALEARGPRGGLDEAAVLIARAEIEEALDQFENARLTITAANAILANSVADDADDDSVTLWCQAQGHLLDALEHAYRVLGLEEAAGGDAVFREAPPGPRGHHAQRAKCALV